MFVRVIKSVLYRLGLERQGRAARRWLQARGLWKWRPLVPAEEFSACVDRSLGRLRDESSGTLDDFGDYLEFGVSRGTSMACVFHALDRAGLTGARLIGFDSFEGMASDALREGWEPGDFSSTISSTRKYLDANGVDLARVELVKGWFSDTLNDETVRRLGLRRTGLVMVDCDVYSASKEALDFVAPLLGDRAVIIFDDWGWSAASNTVGQREAFAEFLQDHPTFEATELESYFEHARVFMVARQRVPDAADAD